MAAYLEPQAGMLVGSIFELARLVHLSRTHRLVRPPTVLAPHHSAQASARWPVARLLVSTGFLVVSAAALPSVHALVLVALVDTRLFVDSDRWRLVAVVDG
jgi:hypothetical protein